MNHKRRYYVVCLALLALFMIPSVGLTESEGAIDINQAPVEELCKLEGIDTVKASAIVAYRESHGPFTSIEDIKHVKGIGDKTFESIKELITVTKTH